MPDLSEIDRSDSTKVAGANASGLETFFLDVESDGGAKVKVRNGTGADAANIQTGQLPATLGQKPMATSLAVTMASDQSAVPIALSDGNKASYSAAVSGFVCAAGTTDLIVIQGSATKIIRITKVSISGTTTAGSGFSINSTLIRRSTANIGGTLASMSAVPHDTADASGTAAVKYYTANPTTLGTQVGILTANRISFPQAGANGLGVNANEIDFGVRPAKAIVLRGVNEYLALNFGGITITGPVVSCTIEWTEET